MNKIFVIEGTDGSGKQTQTAKLYNRLIDNGMSCFKTSFPNYDNQSSGPVKEYLSGNISNDASKISAKAASSFYAVDRYITYKRDIEKYYNDDKTLILFDRYVSSNLLHQGGKLINKESNYTDLDNFTDWLCNFEHNDLELPLPTVIFFLYVPIDYSLKLMDNRKNKFNNSEKKDIHESDTEHLINASKSGYYLAKKLGWSIIECVKDGEMRTIEDIHEEIYSIVKNNI